MRRIRVTYDPDVFISLDLGPVNIARVSGTAEKYRRLLLVLLRGIGLLRILVVYLFDQVNLARLRCLPAELYLLQRAFRRTLPLLHLRRSRLLVFSVGGLGTSSAAAGVLISSFVLREWLGQLGKILLGQDLLGGGSGRLLALVRLDGSLLPPEVEQSVVAAGRGRLFGILVCCAALELEAGFVVVVLPHGRALYCLLVGPVEAALAGRCWPIFRGFGSHDIVAVVEG